MVLQRPGDTLTDRRGRALNTEGVVVEGGKTEGGGGEGGGGDGRGTQRKTRREREAGGVEEEVQRQGGKMHDQ